MPSPHVLPVRVTYIRQGDEDEWIASSKSLDIIPTDITGVVSHATARWEGEPPGSEKHYQVSVFMDVTRLVRDGRVVAPSPIIEDLQSQAIELADARMRSIRPNGKFVHEAEDEDE